MTDPAIPSDELVATVLTALRLGGFAATDMVVDRVGLDAGAVSSALGFIESKGWAVHRAGRVTGWSLTGDGRAEGERRLATELDASGGRDAVTDAYGEFLPLNRRFLDLCTDWQLRSDAVDQALNDHTDADYDRAVIDRLGELHQGIGPILGRIASCLGRFAAYDRRLGSALERVRAGDTEWFTKPVIDSYHTVWFELHEDLLATLRIERSSESGR